MSIVTRLLPALAIAMASLAHAAVDAPVPTCAPDDVPGIGGQCLPGTGSGPPFAGDPRVVAQEVDGMPFNVVLPADYAATSKRYPVLYLFHAFNENQNGWLVNTDLLEFTADQDVIVVLPSAGNTAAVVADGRDGSCRGETQVMEMVAAVDAHYRTLADRAHRAVGGASSGGFNAMHIAARHPDQFVAAGSFSGVPDVTLGLGYVGEIYFLLAERDAVLECGGNPVTGGLFGTPVQDDLWVRNANPADLAPNLRGMSLFVADGNGTPCDADDLPQFHRGQFTPITHQSSLAFTRALDRAGVAYTADLDGCGFHSPRYFEKFLHEFWPQLLAAFGTAPPASFDDRRADPAFSAWGWDVTADPARAPEFLEVRGASSHGVTLTGSGVTTIATAAYFPPQQFVRVHNGDDVQQVLADAVGRITLAVKLGEPHAQQQYTAQNTLAEQAPDYFATRTLRFDTATASGGMNDGTGDAAAGAPNAGGGSFDRCLLLALLLMAARKRNS